jgi:hypothetical protein
MPMKVIVFSLWEFITESYLTKRNYFINLITYCKNSPSVEMPGFLIDVNLLQSNVFFISYISC